MKPAPFAWYRAESAGDAMTLLAEHGDDARLLAGGQSLIPAMNFRLARPSVLVDLNGAADLVGIEPQGAGGIRIGAMTRQRALERSATIAVHAPLLAEAMPWVAHAQIRTRGTVGGSVAHADPAALAVGEEDQLRVRRHDVLVRQLGVVVTLAGLVGDVLEAEQPVDLADERAAARGVEIGGELVEVGDALGVGGIGASKLSASGEVYQLARVSDLEGIYGQVRLGWALANRGDGRLWLQNDKGVVLRLKTKRQGLMLATGADAVRIQLP